MNVLSSCLDVPFLSRLWATGRILAQTVVVPQLRSSFRLSPLHRAPSGVLHPAATTTVSKTPASTSCTCVVDLLFLMTLTVVQQAAGPVPPTGSRWSLACHPSYLPHHTFRHLAACCILPPSSILALSHSER